MHIAIPAYLHTCILAYLHTCIRQRVFILQTKNKATDKTHTDTQSDMVTSLLWKI